MPGIDILKDWDALAKKGWPALFVALLFTGYEVFAPKDPSCTQEVKFLQNELVQYRSAILEHEKEIKEKDTIIHRLHQNDSIYRVKVVTPAKEIINKYEHGK